MDGTWGRNRSRSCVRFGCQGLLTRRGTQTVVTEVAATADVLLPESLHRRSR